MKKKEPLPAMWVHRAIRGEKREKKKRRGGNRPLGERNWGVARALGFVSRCVKNERWQVKRAGAGR